MEAAHKYPVCQFTQSWQEIRKSESRTRTGGARNIYGERQVRSVGVPAGQQMLHTRRFVLVDIGVGSEPPGESSQARRQRGAA